MNSTLQPKSRSNQKLRPYSQKKLQEIVRECIRNKSLPKGTRKSIKEIFIALNGETYNIPKTTVYDNVKKAISDEEKRISKSELSQEDFENLASTWTPLPLGHPPLLGHAGESQLIAELGAQDTIYAAINGIPRLALEREMLYKKVQDDPESKLKILRQKEHYKAVRGLIARHKSNVTSTNSTPNAPDSKMAKTNPLSLINDGRAKVKILAQMEIIHWLSHANAEEKEKVHYRYDTDTMELRYIGVHPEPPMLKVENGEIIVIPLGQKLGTEDEVPIASLFGTGIAIQFGPNPGTQATNGKKGRNATLLLTTFSDGDCAATLVFSEVEKVPVNLIQALAQDEKIENLFISASEARHE